MFARPCILGLSLVCLALFIAGCGNPMGLDSIQVSPGTQSLTLGQTAQFTATGTYGNANHPTTKSITNGVSWSSSAPSVATVDASGVATAVGAGTTTITASATAYNGPVSSSATLAVAGSTTGTGGSGGSILSLTIIPSEVVFGALTESAQLLAIGTFSTTPYIRDLTNSVTWLTSEPNLFPISNYSNTATGTGTQNGGVVTAYGSSDGNLGAVITAEATDSSGSLATATASVSCPLVLPNPPSTPGSCYQDVTQLLSTLTVYNEGLNPNTPEQGGNWLVTAPSATGTPAVINCGPAAGAGNSVCTATYPVNTTVTLTAPAEPGVAFGGWSSNCTNTGTITSTGPNTCTINLSTSDATVGAIFNNSN